MCVCVEGVNIRPRPLSRTSPAEVQLRPWLQLHPSLTSPSALFCFLHLATRGDPESNTQETSCVKISPLEPVSQATYSAGKLETPGVGPGTEVAYGSVSSGLAPSDLQREPPSSSSPTISPIPCAQMTLSCLTDEVSTTAQIPQSQSWSNPVLRSPKVSLQEGDLEMSVGIGEAAGKTEFWASPLHQLELLCL